MREAAEAPGLDTPGLDRRHGDSERLPGGHQDRQVDDAVLPAPTSMAVWGETQGSPTQDSWDALAVDAARGENAAGERRARSLPIEVSMTVLASPVGRPLAAALLVVAAASALAAGPLLAQTQSQPRIDVDARLKGFDDEMAQVMKDWNAPGIGIGIVVNDKLVFAKGYGFRDYGKKLPVHAHHDAADCLQHEALHRRRRGPARRGGQAALGRTGQAIRSRHPLLQRRPRPLGDDSRHAVAPDRRDPPRRHLVQVGVHATRVVGPPALPRTRRPDPDDLSLQQPDVHGGRSGGGGTERADMGDVRAAPDLRPAGHVALHADD